MTQKQWTRVLDDKDLVVGSPRTIKLAQHQIALFRLPNGEIHAIDNRCPHEGYPLSTGRIDEGILTCEWHNWKFRLCDGACVLGGEGVRSYPSRVENGEIQLDLSEAPGAERQPGLYQSLDTSFYENDWGHAARTVERLLMAGATSAEIIGFGCDYAAARAPYGFDHGLATAADILAMKDSYDDVPGVPIVEALNLMVEPNVRRAERPVGQPVAVAVSGSDWSQVETDLRDAIEAEDLARSEGILLGAIAAGAGPDDVFRWLTHAATDHFLDYGHGHIYCVKAEELISAIGWNHAHPVLTSLVTSLVYGTREDRLPYMRSFQKAMAKYDDARMARWAAGTASSAAPNIEDMLDVLLEGSLEDALAGVASELDRGVAPDRIALVLGLAAAYRVMRFDPRCELRDDISESWLSVSHVLTYADAVRESLLRRPSAECLRGLFYSARFVQHTQPLDTEPKWRANIRGGITSTLDLGKDPLPLQLQRSLRANLFGLAIAVALTGMEPGSELRRTFHRYVMSDGASVPLFVDHHIKTAAAGLRLHDALAADLDLGPRGDNNMPLMAAIRFVAFPLHERRIARQAMVANGFVRDGRMPTRLLGY